MGLLEKAGALTVFLALSRSNSANTTMTAQHLTSLNATYDWPVFAATLLAAIGEFFIFWAIISEVRGSRETSFLHTVVDKPFYDDRANLYSHFLTSQPTLVSNPDRRALWQKSDAFSAHICTKDGSEVRKIVDSQLVHLNQIALLYGKHGMFSRDKELIEWFPHTVALCWIMLGPYIFRRKELTGHFWAKALVSYALACIEFVLKDPDAALIIFPDTPGIRQVQIDRQVLLAVRHELKDVDKASSRDEVRQVFEALRKSMNEVGRAVPGQP